MKSLRFPRDKDLAEPAPAHATLVPAILTFARIGGAVPDRLAGVVAIDRLRAWRRSAVTYGKSYCSPKTFPAGKKKRKRENELNLVDNLFIQKLITEFKPAPINPPIGGAPGWSATP
jgi:hypothetical protein